MPVDRKRYPANWKAISAAIRERSGGRCECSGECGLHKTTPGPRRCTECHGEPAKWAKGKVILTVAHLGVPKPDGSLGSKHDKMDCRPENLRAYCQRCHLRFDMDEHVQNAKRTRARKQWANQLPLPGHSA
jgi:hypothetical protein